MGKIYIGTDSGATTTKISAVDENGEPVSREVMQKPTRTAEGKDAVIAGWIGAIDEFLSLHNHSWEEVAGAGLAIPGPYLARGVMDRSANFPPEFSGWNVLADFSRALTERAGHNVPLVVGNDGNFGGIAEAYRARGDGKMSVLMLMPGSGLGCAFIDPEGRPLEGDTLAGMEAGHTPVPLHLLGWNNRPLRCGCGRDWGCVEIYTSMAGLPYLLEAWLIDFPEHQLAKSSDTPREKAISLRARAQQGDPMACEIFEFQARAMGLHVASLAMTLDPGMVVIGGGLMDPEATTPEFRENYLRLVRETASPYLWTKQRETLQVVPATLGDLSQAIGAAMAARLGYTG